MFTGTVHKYNESERIQSFWSKVNKRGPNDCWPWLGGTDKLHYGKFWNGHKIVNAARFSLELSIGPIGELHCLHNCNNAICVNPNHLRPGTKYDNALDAVDAGTIGRRCRFSIGEVWLMIRLRGAGLIYSEIAPMFKAHRGQVSRLIRGTSGQVNPK